MEPTEEQLKVFIDQRLEVCDYNKGHTECGVLKRVEIRDRRVYAEFVWLAKSACPPNDTWIKVERTTCEICLEFSQVLVLRGREIRINVPLEGLIATFSFVSDRSPKPSSVQGLELPDSVH